MISKTMIFDALGIGVSFDPRSNSFLVTFANDSSFEKFKRQFEEQTEGNSNHG